MRRNDTARYVIELSNGRTIPTGFADIQTRFGACAGDQHVRWFHCIFQLEGAKPKMLKVGEKLIKVTNPADYSTF